MKYPEIVKEYTEYFNIIVFPKTEYYGKHHGYYKTAKTAENAAEKLIKTGLYKFVDIRKEEVYRREKNLEISSSGIYKVLEA